MTSGLLWYDNKNPLAQVIADAAKRYHEKYGYSADTIFVNPASAQGEAFNTLRADYAARGVSVQSKSTILPNHVWLGVSAAREPLNQ